MLCSHELCLAVRIDWQQRALTDALWGVCVPFTIFLAEPDVRALDSVAVVARNGHVVPQAVVVPFRSRHCTVVH